MQGRKLRELGSDFFLNMIQKPLGTDVRHAHLIPNQMTSSIIHQFGFQVMESVIHVC